MKQVRVVTRIYGRECYIMVIYCIVLTGAFISLFPNQLKAPQGWKPLEAYCQWALLSCQQSACWVFSCFRNRPNSDMDYRIFNVRTWSFLCARIHTGGWAHRQWVDQHNIFDSEKLAQFIPRVVFRLRYFIPPKARLYPHTHIILCVGSADCVVTAIGVDLLCCSNMLFFKLIWWKETLDIQIQTYLSRTQGSIIWTI